MNIVFIGSHLGYPMDRTPLGGGAMVGLRLIRHWLREGACELTVIGSGPQAPAPGAFYVRLPEGGGRDLVRLSELAYARFCRDFEAASTAWLLARREDLPPGKTAVLINDVSEGPNLAALAKAGYPIVSLWHVDVVDFFNKIYLRGLLAPERLTRLYERGRRMGLRAVVPDLLRLVFEKQREAVARSSRLIVPSRAMAQTLGRCYAGVRPGDGLERRLRVVPWGAWEEDAPPAPDSQVRELRGRYQIGPKTSVLMTLSRISPEKGIHLLLEALRLLEADGRLAGRDLALLICGEAAFMRGAAYQRRLRLAAGALRRTRVFFPGYLDAAGKRAHFRLARLFVSPSVHESYGLNVVEAMQAGLPVLASDHYGVRELIDSDCGRMVPYGNLAEAPRRLAGALAELLPQEEKLARMGELARKRASGMPFSGAADAVLAACRESLVSVSPSGGR